MYYRLRAEWEGVVRGRAAGVEGATEEGERWALTRLRIHAENCGECLAGFWGCFPETRGKGRVAPLVDYGEAREREERAGSLRI